MNPYTTLESTILPTEQNYEPLDQKQGVILSVIILPGLIGNVFALVSTAKIMKLQVKVAPNYYVFALSSIDLFLLVACSSPTLICYLSGRWQGGQIMCDFQGIMSLFCSLSSGSVAALLAVDRFFAVTKPLFYRSHTSINCVAGLIATAVLISMLISLLPIAGFGSFSMNLTGTYCTINWFSTVPKHAAFSYMYASVGFGLVVTIVTVNITVIVRLINERRKKAIIFNAGLPSTTISRQEKSDSTQIQRLNQQNANQTLDGSLPVACRAPPSHSRSSSRQTARRLHLKHTDLEAGALKLSIAVSVLFLICWLPFMVGLIGPKYI